jgi:hypothetical protein
MIDQELYRAAAAASAYLRAQSSPAILASGTAAASPPPPDPEAQIEALLVKAKNPDLTPEARFQIVSEIKALRPPGQPTFYEAIRPKEPARR